MLTRRGLLQRASQTGLAAALPLAPRTLVQPPDILVVVLDDMRTSDWEALPLTRAMLSGATMYPNFIVSCPLCGPSRASLFTGQQVHNHGINSNGSWDEFHQRVPASEQIQVLAQGQGYHTVLSGKFINGAPERGSIGPGWSRFYVCGDEHYVNFPLNENGKTRRYRGRGSEAKYSTKVLEEHLVQEIVTTASQTPMLMVYAPQPPHRPAIPAPQHRKAYDNVNLQRTPAFNEFDVSDKPKMVRNLPRFSQSKEANLERLNRRRLATMASADESITNVVRAISQARSSENLYVFIMSDNGWAMGDHRLTEKKEPYDACTRIPMLAHGPQFGQGENQRLCGIVDIAPTIAELMQTTLSTVDGVSLLSDAERDAMLVEGPEGRYAALRSLDELYVERKSGEREYYDYRDDPYELSNRLASWGGYVPTLDPTRAQQLASRLVALRTCAGERCWNAAASSGG